MKIKVMHIAQSNGGVSEYLKMFFKYSDREKYDIYLVCSHNYLKKDIDILRKYAKEVYIVSMERELSPKKDLIATIKISNIIRQVKPDIVHCHSSKAGVYGRIACMLRKTKCVYNSHGWSFNMNISDNKKKIYAFIEKSLAYFTDVIVNVSCSEEELGRKYKIASKDKMVVINNGIDLENFKSDFEKIEGLQHLEDRMVIGMVARITECKDPYTFLEIAKKISKLIPNSMFILVGDGELREEIESKISKYGLEDHFIIVGWTDRVKDYLQYFDIGLLTSKWEGFGLVLAEYMAAGVPIVASNVGGIPNVVENCSNGYLCESGNVDEFVERILTIKNNNEVREKFICEGKNTVKQKFDVKRVVREHEKVYSSLLLNKF